MKRLLFNFALACAFVFSMNSLQAQTYESRNYIKIPPNREIIKTMKASKCTEVLDSGYVVHHEFKRKLDGVEYTISKTDSLTRDKSYYFDKAIKVKLKSLPGKANLTVDEKDPSLFQVNYWLSSEVVLKIGTTIQLLEGKLGCDTLMDYKGTKHVLKSDTSFYLAWVYLNDTLNKDLLKNLKYKKYDTTHIKNTTDAPILGNKAKGNLVIASFNDTVNDWYKYSDLILKTYEGERLTGVYANMFDRNGQYTLKLQNSEYISYPKGGWQFGALTIPFKYRFGYEKTVEGVDIKVKDDFIADLNIGAYGGYQWGKHRFRMEGNKLKELSRLGWSVGAFFNLSTVTLDSLNTTAGVTPFGKDEKSSIGIFSPGIAAMFTLYNFQLGAFAGWDLGLGQDRKNWNHNNRFWLGFGFGYNLGGFWKK